MNFKDHFSGHSEHYRAYRPGYPESLFSTLASLTDETRLAWDCATGTGQAAKSLAGYFEEVIATDASSNQIANAETIEGVTYKVAPAERSGIASSSIDLITVAQAIHWFDLTAFSSEANRTLKDRGILAAWTYGLLTIEEDIDEIIQRFYRDIVGAYWPFERKLVESGYANLQMPFEEISIAPIEMTEAWSFRDLIGYLNTWSAVKGYEKEHGQNPLEIVYDELQQQWGKPRFERLSRWPLFVKVWRKTNNP